MAHGTLILVLMRAKSPCQLGAGAVPAELPTAGWHPRSRPRPSSSHSHTLAHTHPHAPASQDRKKGGAPRARNHSDLGAGPLPDGAADPWGGPFLADLSSARCHPARGTGFLGAGPGQRAVTVMGNREPQPRTATGLLAPREGWGPWPPGTDGAWPTGRDGAWPPGRDGAWPTGTDGAWLGSTHGGLGTSRFQATASTRLVLPATAARVLQLAGGVELPPNLDALLGAPWEEMPTDQAWRAGQGSELAFPAPTQPSTWTGFS